MTKSPAPHAPSPLGWTPAEGFPLPGAPGRADDRIGFILRLGRSLHDSGYAAHRLEEALTIAAEQLGLEAQFYSTPTSIMASFGPVDDQRAVMIRVQPQDTNLGRLALVDEATRMVLNGQLTPFQGSRRLDVIERAPPIYPRWLNVVAFAGASGASACFLQGGWREMAAAGLIGLTIGLLAVMSGHHPSLSRVFEPVSALIASFFAALLAVTGFPISVFLATLGGVIVLLPGYMVTSAMTELSTRHLASGTARFMGALVILIGLIFGIALGGKLAALVFGEVPTAVVVPTPEWVLPLALIVTPLAFMVLLRAQPRDAGWIVVSSLLSYAGAFIGTRGLGPELGAFVGAFVCGLTSAWYARLTNRPAQIALVPGLLLLVPGSVGLRSMASLLDNHYQLGVEGAFRMVLIAVSLVAGTLIAAIVSPRRKLLV